MRRPRASRTLAAAAASLFLLAALLHAALGARSLGAASSVALLSPIRPAATARRVLQELRAFHARSRLLQLQRDLQLELYLSYRPSWGLCNQLFSHLGVLALAAQLNATVALPPAQSRPSFQGAPVWEDRPLGSLLDVGRMRAHWRRQGLRLEQAANTSRCVTVELGRCSEHTAHRTALQGWGTKLQHQVLPLGDAASTVAACIATGTQGLLERGGCIHLVYGNPFESILIDFPRSVPYLTPVAHGLFFAPRLLRLADQVVAVLPASGFLGLHLRLEGDWQAIGPENAADKDPSVVLLRYMVHMAAAGFSRDSVVYAASGIFAYQNATETEQLESLLRAHGVCGQLAYKERLLPPGALAGLHSEQLALVDLLVLARAEAVVGDGRSSFSSFVREWRALREGRPKASFHSVVPPDMSDFFVFTP